MNGHFRGRAMMDGVVGGEIIANGMEDTNTRGDVSCSKMLGFIAPPYKMPDCVKLERTFAIE